MDVLKKIFPLSWKMTKDTTNFIVGIVIYVVLGFVFGLVSGLASLLVGWIPVAGFIFDLLLSIIGYFVSVYSLMGLVLLILVFCKVIKD